MLLSNFIDGYTYTDNPGFNILHDIKFAICDRFENAIK